MTPAIRMNPNLLNYPNLKNNPKPSKVSLYYNFRPQPLELTPPYKIYPTLLYDPTL